MVEMMNAMINMTLMFNDAEKQKETHAKTMDAAMKKMEKGQFPEGVGPGAAEVAKIYAQMAEDHEKAQQTPALPSPAEEQEKEESKQDSTDNTSTTTEAN